ncbi:MAG TPA: PEP-CTERM sorting domain-containing protein [Acetobacteraceae bacterium]|nr:PEP-CTERM sorting domain-containing protein [Acetobacteraceae bacterium]
MNLTHTPIAKACGTAVLLGLLTPVPLAAAPVLFEVGGTSSPASISGTVGAFRTALGDPNNGNAPGTTGGRREINWDGGGGVDTNAVAGTPFSGFLQTRGALFATPGTGFVQAPPSGGPQNGLAGQFNNATYGSIFSTFSPLRDFTPIGSTVTDATFFIPGTNGGTAATVGGFGAVFSNVELADSARIDFFDPNGNLLTEQFVPIGSGPASLSFLGVVFDAGEDIGSVMITSGTDPLASGTNDDPAGGVNLVVMDDFLFSEPVARVVPEPASLWWFGTSLAGLGLLRWRRRLRNNSSV